MQSIHSYNANMMIWLWMMIIQFTYMYNCNFNIIFFHISFSTIHIDSIVESNAKWLIFLYLKRYYAAYGYCPQKNYATMQLEWRSLYRSAIIIPMWLTNYSAFMELYHFDLLRSSHHRITSSPSSIEWF